MHSKKYAASAGCLPNHILKKVNLQLEYDTLIDKTITKGGILKCQT